MLCRRGCFFQNAYSETVLRIKDTKHPREKSYLNHVSYILDSILPVRYITSVFIAGQIINKNQFCTQRQQIIL